MFLCKNQQFLRNVLQNNASWNALYVERGLGKLHLNINIVYSKVLQALSIILTNQCDMSKQVITIWSKQRHN